MSEDKIAVADTPHKTIKSQCIFLPFISFLTSLQVWRFFVSLSDFEHCYQFSTYLPPLKSFHIIFEDFLMDFWLPALAAAFPDIPFDVFVSHWHTAFTCQQTSKPARFGSQACLRAFFWLEEVIEIKWQILRQHWSHIPTLEKIASVAFLTICCFMAKPWFGGWGGWSPKELHKMVSGWQGRNQP